MEWATEFTGIDTIVVPSGAGCVECEQQRGWWFHLRRFAQCGHIGCCDNSPGQHGSAHAESTGHPWITSYEPEEHWFYDYRDQQVYEYGPKLAPPEHHPIDQPTPGPAWRVPVNWEELLR